VHDRGLGVDGGRLRAGNECAMPMLAELTMGEQKLYIDVIDVMKFNDDGKVASMRAFWNPAEMRPTREA
jgi:steroid delta-isomerase